jgi:hypothetical protein
MNKKRYVREEKIVPDCKVVEQSRKVRPKVVG